MRFTPPSELLVADVIAFIRREIEAAGGNEVLFLASSGPDGLISQVTVAARGNAVSAPAIINRARCGDLLLHNHPSGSLTPSAEDIHVASVVGERGTGFCITDNDVGRLYVVVPPYAEERVSPLSVEEVVAHLGPGSSMAAALKGYEERPEQLEMASSVATAFNDERIGLIEAGTGIGKSMAYLIPALLWAMRNRERVVVATHTIALQEQLMEKDIPFIKTKLFSGFKAVLVKGRGNYACRRKASVLSAEGGYLFEDGEKGQEETLLRWMEKTKDGSRADLGFVPRESSWEKIASEADLCRRARCAFYSECFFYRARKEAADADLLVANHHLLFADIAVKGESGGYGESAVMPPYQRIILDEAHNVEEVATEYFGAGVSRRGLNLLLGRFVARKDRRKGLLPHLQLKMAMRRGEASAASRAEGERIIGEDLLPAIERLRDLAAEFFDFMGYFAAQPGRGDEGEGERREERLRIIPPLKASPRWGEVETKGRGLIDEGRGGLRSLQAVIRLMEGWPEEEKEGVDSQRLELKAYFDRLQRFVSTLDAFLFQEMEESVKWVEISERESGTSVRLVISPLSVAPSMKEKVYDRLRTVILTSATLSVRGRFDYMRGRLGLDAGGERLMEVMLRSPFDFERQAYIGIPTDLPAPGEEGYAARLSDHVAEALVISKGRAFVLFTAYRLLREIHKGVSKRAPLRGYLFLKQGDEPRSALLDRLRREKKAVLFGSDSFWEGVDVPGEALSCVILTKLPFSVPDDPLIEARAEMIERGGGSAFMHYLLPQAVLRFRQGFGRLIRSKTDRGAVLILDSRVVNKKYGRFFLESLPPCRIDIAPGAEVIKGMGGFFRDQAL